jgi:hypothetical protein
LGERGKEEEKYLLGVDIFQLVGVDYLHAREASSESPITLPDLHTSLLSFLTFTRGGRRTTHGQT